MSQWKAHKLAGEPRDGLRLEPGQKIRSVADLPGVPAGTAGAVVLTAGFQWLRYRVRFANGVELGFLDGRHIEAFRRRAGRRRQKPR